MRIEPWIGQGLQGRVIVGGGLPIRKERGARKRPGKLNHREYSLRFGHRGKILRLGLTGRRGLGRQIESHIWTESLVYRIELLVDDIDELAR